MPALPSQRPTMVAKAYDERYSELIEARARIAELETENERCEEWGKSEARMKEQAEATIERLKYILDRIEMSGQGEMLAQYACDWAERSTP